MENSIAIAYTLYTQYNKQNPESIENWSTHNSLQTFGENSKLEQPANYKNNAFNH